MKSEFCKEAAVKVCELSLEPFIPCINDADHQDAVQTKPLDSTSPPNDEQKGFGFNIHQPHNDK